MKKYVIEVEVTVEASESEQAILQLADNLKKCCTKIRVISITDEGGEKTYIRQNFSE